MWLIDVRVGVMQAAESLPIHREALAGNMAETHTLVPTIEKVLARLPKRRVVLLVDRGLLSLDSLDAVKDNKVQSDPPEFILAVPARCHADFDDVLGTAQHQLFLPFSAQRT